MHDERLPIFEKLLLSSCHQLSLLLLLLYNERRRLDQQPLLSVFGSKETVALSPWGDKSHNDLFLFFLVVRMFTLFSCSVNLIATIPLLYVLVLRLPKWIRVLLKTRTRLINRFPRNAHDSIRRSDERMDQFLLPWTTGKPPNIKMHLRRQRRV